MSETETIDIIKLHDLKKKMPKELIEISGEFDIESASAMRKQELMFE